VVYVGAVLSPTRGMHRVLVYANLEHMCISISALICSPALILEKSPCAVRGSSLTSITLRSILRVFMSTERSQLDGSPPQAVDAESYYKQNIEVHTYITCVNRIRQRNSLKQC
jgi:hypothetical protein